MRMGIGSASGPALTVLGLAAEPTPAEDTSEPKKRWDGASVWYAPGVNTDQIRETVQKALAHEAEHGTLARLIGDAVRRDDPTLDDAAAEARTDATLGAIAAYIEAMVNVIDETLAAAGRAGVADDMRPIFETAITYVHEDVDFIPDSLGLAGLIDDAYLVHGLMQEISQRHRALIGKDLLPPEYFAETQRVRRMIGEPTATRLDVAIVAFARRHNVRNTIQQIFERIGATGMSMDLPVTVAFGRGDDSIDEAPNLELGSLGE